MSSSAARLAANRQNALKSSGPKTAEGKDRSRLNAFRHGLAGAGDLVAPGEDAARVARRAATFARELAASGEVGELLAHRAALLSVRMQRAAERDMAVVAANILTARVQFDADRLDAIDGWISDLATTDHPSLPLLRLEASPEGLEFLIDHWLKLHAAVEAGDPQAVAEATRWLDLGEVSTAGSLAHALDLAARIDNELDWLHHLAESSADLVAAIDAARNEAGKIASFDPSPEAALAHRYEAAAERGMYRAIREIAELRRAQTDEMAALPLSLPLPAGPPAVAPPPRQPTPPPDLPIHAGHTPLGSFRAEGLATAAPLTKLITPLLGPDLDLPTPRKKRPDLRKLHASRR